MRVCLISYPVPHLKTQQVFLNLVRRGGAVEIGFLAAPFTSRPERSVMVRHRPPQQVGPDLRTLAGRFGRPIHAMEEWCDVVDRYDCFIVGGAGILPPEFVESARVLNAHPGLLFQTRGLDSFKWAILDQVQVGVSLHYIDRDVDAGELVATVPTPVFHDDDLMTFATRHYEAEIDVLSNWQTYLDGHARTAYQTAPPRRRMPAEVEAGLPRAFASYKEKFSRSNSA